VIGILKASWYQIRKLRNKAGLSADNPAFFVCHAERFLGSGAESGDFDVSF